MCLSFTLLSCQIRGSSFQTFTSVSRDLRDFVARRDIGKQGGKNPIPPKQTTPKQK